MRGILSYSQYPKKVTVCTPVSYRYEFMKESDNNSYNFVLDKSVDLSKSLIFVSAITSDNVYHIVNQCSIEKCDNINYTHTITFSDQIENISNYFLNIVTYSDIEMQV